MSALGKLLLAVQELSRGHRLGACYDTERVSKLVDAVDDALVAYEMSGEMPDDVYEDK
jgi:hypothetical protein